jgi:hypothetical protein
MEYPFARELWTGGRKRTLRKRTRRGGQGLQARMAYMIAAGGRNRTLRKRTRRGGQMYKALFGGRKRTRRGGQILVETQ